MGAVVLAILVHHPSQDPSAAVVVEVGIDIRQVDAVGVEESLKQEVVFQRVYLGDAQTVGHHGSCRRSTSRSHHHAQFGTGRVDEVLDDEEVARETHRLHHVELEVDMLADALLQGVAIESAGALVGQLRQVVGLKLDAVDLVVASESVDDLLSLLGRELVLSLFVGGELVVEVLLGIFLSPLLLRSEFLGDGEEGHDGSVVDVVDLHLVEHLDRVGESLGHVGKDLVHLLPRLKPFLLRVAHAVGVVEVLLGGETEQVVVGLGRLAVFEVTVVGADELDAQFFSQPYEFAVGALLQGEGLAVGHDRGVLHLVALELQIVVVAEEVVIPLCGLSRALQVSVEDLAWHLARYTGRADDQSLVVALQVGPVRARLVVVAVHPRARYQFNKVFVSLVVFGQDDEVVATIVSHGLVLVLLGASCDIHLTSEDGLEGFEALRLALLVDLGAAVGQLLHAIHHAMVGDGHAPHAVPDGLLHEVGYLRLAVKDGVVRMDVQMYEVFHQFSYFTCKCR